MRGHSDCIFTVTVSRRILVHSCREKVEQERRGLFGFHLAERCAECRLENDGFECWGSNGHLQASPATRELLVHWIKLQARREWRMQDGRSMGFRFRAGRPLYYRGADVPGRAVSLQPAADHESGHSGRRRHE